MLACFNDCKSLLFRPRAEVPFSTDPRQKHENHIPECHKSMNLLIRVLRSAGHSTPAVMQKDLVSEKTYKELCRLDWDRRCRGSKSSRCSCIQFAVLVSLLSDQTNSQTSHYRTFSSKYILYE